MKVEEFTNDYLQSVKEEDKNLITVAFDEMNSSQYEEATTHFDQLYVKNPSDYMYYFFRAYCKSHCGTKGNVVANAEKFTAAFNFAYQKAINMNIDLEANSCIIVKMYDEGMSYLASNAVEYESGITIEKEKKKNIIAFIEDNVEVIKNLPGLKEYVVEYLKKRVDDDLVRYGNIIIALDSAYVETYEEKQKAIEDLLESERKEREKELEIAKKNNLRDIIIQCASGIGGILFIIIIIVLFLCSC